MENDAKTIRAAASEAATLLRYLETTAIQAREARDDEAREAAMTKLREAQRSIETAIAQIVAGATVAVPRRGLKDPVVDLDQEPQD